MGGAVGVVGFEEGGFEGGGVFVGGGGWGCGGGGWCGCGGGWEGVEEGEEEEERWVHCCGGIADCIEVYDRCHSRMRCTTTGRLLSRVANHCKSKRRGEGIVG